MGNTLEKKKAKKQPPELNALTKPIRLDRSTKANREHNEKIFLSPDVFLQILGQIEVRGFCAAICTCKTWRRLCDVDENWKAFSIALCGQSASMTAAFEELRLANYSWRDIFKLKCCAFAIDYIPAQYMKGLLAWQSARYEEKKKSSKSGDQDLLAPFVNIGLKGPGGAGKSSFVIRLFQDQFVDEYDPTIEDSYRFNRDKGRFAAMGIKGKFEIYDEAGMEECYCMRPSRREAGYFILYDITREYSSSLKQALIEIENILRIFDQNTHPIVLVGAKLDLAAERVITREMGIEVARNYGIGFVELSSKTNTNTEEALAALAMMINVWPSIKKDLEEEVMKSPMMKNGRNATNMTQEEISKLIEKSRCTKRTSIISI